MEKNKKTLIKNLLWTFLYGVVTLFVVMHHEIWADEAQVWMLVKNLSVFGLFKHLVNEGHPSFFYLIIMPFAKLNFSIFAMQIICWLSSCAAVFLLLQFSPFNKIAKFAIISSAGFLYFFPVIARSYSILPFLVFLAAILYNKQKEHPILYALTLVFIANTHIIMFAFSFILGIMFLFKCFIKDKTFNKQCIVCAILIAFGFMSVILQLHGTTSSNVFISIDFNDLVSNTFKVFSQFFINSYDNQYPDLNRFMLPSIGVFAIFASIILYLIFFVTLFLNSKKLFCIAFLSIAFQFVIYILGYNHWIFVTRIFCAHIIMIFCFWVMLNNPDYKPAYRIFDKKFINCALALFFLLTLLNGLKYSVLDIFNNYSSAKDTAEFIEKNIDKNSSILITDNDPHSIALVYYLDKKYDIYSAMHQKYFKYVVWDESLFHILSNEGWGEYVKFMKEQNNEEFKTKKIYAIVPSFDMYKLNVTNLKDFKLIYESKPAIVKFEGFRLFEYTGKY